MTAREDLTARLDEVEAVTGPTTGVASGVTIVLDAEYVDREPEADNVVLSSDYRGPPNVGGHQ